MVELAGNAFGHAPVRVQPGLRGTNLALKAVPPCRCDFHDVRNLGYAPNLHALEGRQLQVAQLVALGLADKEIAFYLTISQGTVKGHVSTILRLLGLFRRTQICRYVHEAGLFPAG